MPVTTLEQALARLPHGDEFRFLDRLLTLEGGKSGTGEYRVRGDESFLRGHFPGDPLMPGVILIEAAAQLAGVVGQSDPNIPALRGLKLTALRSMKIYGSARPGETVALEAIITTRLGPLFHARVKAWTAGVKLLEGELTFSGQLGQ